MKHILSYGLLALCFAGPVIQADAQTMSHEEEVVRNAYAKLGFLCAVSPLTDAALAQSRGTQADLEDIDKKIAAAMPVFRLSDFQVGSIADIARRPWGDFVSAPPEGAQVLQASGASYYYSDSGNQEDWTAVRLYWAPSPSDPAAENVMMGLPVATIIELASKQWSGKIPVTYTRYAAFTADLSFQGKTTGPHRAIFLFGVDPGGNEFVAENDLVSGTQIGIWHLLQTPSYPAGFLRSKLREIPAVSTWIRANEMPASSCNQTRLDVCCSHGRCGISQTDLNRDLSAPLPFAKEKDGAGSPASLF